MTYALGAIFILAVLAALYFIAKSGEDDWNAEGY